MQRKMDLLERAHGLLCNPPGDGSAESGEEWRKLRVEWIERWHHLLVDQRTKKHNRLMAIRNEAITDYQRREEWSRSELVDEPAGDEMIRQASSYMREHFRAHGDASAAWEATGHVFKLSAVERERAKSGVTR